jgi:hypothetical protein
VRFSRFPNGVRPKSESEDKRVEKNEAVFRMEVRREMNAYKIRIILHR